MLRSCAIRRLPRVGRTLPKVVRSLADEFHRAITLPTGQPYFSPIGSTVAGTCSNVHMRAWRDDNSHIEDLGRSVSISACRAETTVVVISMSFAADVSLDAGPDLDSVLLPLL